MTPSLWMFPATCLIQHFSYLGLDASHFGFDAWCSLEAKAWGGMCGLMISRINLKI